MKVLILGAGGMMGHKLFWFLRRQKDMEVAGSLRKSLADYAQYPFWHKDGEGIHEGVDAGEAAQLKRLFAAVRPQVVVNCVGVIKSLAKDPLSTIEINAALPHRLVRFCDEHGARLIHISTDCVFSGSKGGYSEDSTPDAYDLYGRSKLLGEPVNERHLTVRTSIIGRELGTRNNLIEWFLSQRGKVAGFTEAHFTGLTTMGLSEVLHKLIVEKPEVSGLMHVHGEKINKNDLLNLVKEAFKITDVLIEPKSDFHCDRSLTSQRFSQLGIAVPSMKAMIAQMYAEDEFYAVPAKVPSREAVRC